MSLEGGALQTGVNFPEGISYEYRRPSSVGQSKAQQAPLTKHGWKQTRGRSRPGARRPGR